MSVKRRIVATTIIACAVGVAAGLSAHQFTTISTVRPSESTESTAHLKGIDPKLLGSGSCPTPSSSALGAVVSLHPGYNASSLLNAGFASAPLLSDGTGAPTANAGNLMFVRAQLGKDTSAVAASLRQLPAVSAATVLLPQSSNPNLHSCSYDLGDRSEAVSLVGIAQRAASAAGLLNSPLHQELVSDNPLTPGGIIVTLYADGGVTGTGPFGLPLHATRTTAALMKLDGTVVAVGMAPWGQS
ncbi:MAG: hypothetical protein ACREQ5_01885 [Candidatus Dormibacteria bacterium]